MRAQLLPEHINDTINRGRLLLLRARVAPPVYSIVYRPSNKCGATVSSRRKHKFPGGKVFTPRTNICDERRTDTWTSPVRKAAAFAAGLTLYEQYGDWYTGR